MRLTLIRTADRRYELLYDCHHVGSDGWSLGVIMRDLFDAYQVKSGRLHGTTGGKTRAPGSYDAYLRFLGRQDPERSKAFWRRVLEGIEAPTPLVMERSLPAGEHGLRLDAGPKATPAGNRCDGDTRKCG